MESAAVGAFLQVLFDRFASREFINFFIGRKDEKKLLKKLEIRLLGVGSLLNDAELKQWTDKAVKAWVKELKDVIFRADDLVDEIATKAMQSKLDSEFPSSSSSTESTRDLRELISRFIDPDMESRIEEILERLEDLENEKDSLGLTKVIVVGQNNNIPSRMLPPTTCLVDDASVYGRDGDKHKIIQLLISGDDDDDSTSSSSSSSGHRIGVIPIVGMGGIGKTTLAQLVYNDPQVIKSFEEQVWACVSEEFDILRLTKSIVVGLSLPCSSNDDLNTLQVKLRGRLAGKKFLIVLDDVWNENPNHWDILRRPFLHGKHGSKIIVTTRNKAVASIMQTVPNFHLEQLSNDDCWQLFSKHAFENVSPSDQTNIKRIAEKIVEKCKGLPLALKTLGGLLRYKVEVEEWENVLESHFWDLPKDKSNILPALLLSYHHLPSHLKLCFAYCAIIPKDYEFKKDELVPLWIAEGIVQQPRSSGRVEEIGDRYFRELSSRSLFQQSSDNKFLMHDLINDLAQFVDGEYCFRLEDDHPHDISKVRYFSYFKDARSDSFAKLKAINEASCLRTFKPLSSYYHIPMSLSDKVLHAVLPTLRCLRVLSLSGYNISELPSSIGNLIHLRYLDLSLTHIQCLPETLSRLCNLETLLLRCCRYLTRLPTYLCKLICLRHLHISGTYLIEMPMQIGRLRSLRRLTNFVVGNQIGSTISELRQLHHLHGTLSISNLQNVLIVKDAIEANLKDKKYLEELELEWVANHTDDSVKAREVIEALQPHINLKHLTIKHYGGTRFPGWLGGRSFLNLKALCLRGCTYCTELPPLGQLPSLQELTIARMSMVLKVGSEFYEYNSSGIESFQSLKKLTFEDMPIWEEWSILGARKFSHLLGLRIIKCPKLIGEFPKHLPYLKKLEIDGCQRLVIENILKPDDDGEMVSDSTAGVVPLQHLPSLQVLQIENISGLQILPVELCRLTNLEELKIWNCPMLNTIQIIGGDHRSLSSLQIWRCPKLELPLSEDTKHYYKYLQVLTIEGGSCDSLKSFPLGFFPKLRNLCVSNCRNLESLLGLDELQTLTSLQSLEFRDCPNFVSFVDGGGLPAPNLTKIEIRSCEKLKALPEQMCTLLPSLEFLDLETLPEIESFPLGGLPSSLNYLAIWECDKLMARRTEWGLQSLPSLSSLQISGECEEDKLLESFPEECLLPPSLTNLTIDNRPNLKSLNPSCLRHLNSLEHLRISRCHNLQSLPDEGMPSSLQGLKILNCPLLKVCCQREKGEDWLKISHIPDIEIDGDF